jgi:hypothetical protein
MISIFGIPYTVIFDTKKKPLPPKPKPKPKPNYHDYSDKFNYSKLTITIIVINSIIQNLLKKKKTRKTLHTPKGSKLSFFTNLI